MARAACHHRAMNDFFRLDHDPATGIAELVFNRPERMNTSRPCATPCRRSTTPATRAC
jgi:hypothetical protein